MEHSDTLKSTYFYDLLFTSIYTMPGMCHGATKYLKLEEMTAGWL
jgi:hypothetical protein